MFSGMAASTDLLFGAALKAQIQVSGCCIWHQSVSQSMRTLVKFVSLSILSIFGIFHNR